MQIKDMFRKKIDREIQGVIIVGQGEETNVAQELDEYVVTRELQRHFAAFFAAYKKGIQGTTPKMGVWISGFFGSGKSHFLKMLSYLLENKEVKGIHSVERFRKKFEDDPATFMLIDRATKGQTETILFNIDIEGFSNKDKTAVLRVFAKMFYNHLGFYGENLKVAMMERYIDQQGKTEEFRRVFEEKKGKPWLEMRRAFAFNGKFIIPTLMKVLDMSEDDAKTWFNDKTATEISIAQLVEDMKAYVEARNESCDGKCEAFFVRKDGRAMLPGTVRLIVKRNLSKVVTLKKRSPHVLRHTFATSMLNNHANLEAVKELLGHESLTTTEVYTHTTFEELKKVYKQAHPRA